VSPEEAEFAIDHADAPWPEQKGNGKFVVWGPTEAGRLIQVIFVIKSPDEIEFEALTIIEWAELDEDDRILYVIHAMDLTGQMKRRHKKRLRQP